MEIEYLNEYLQDVIYTLATNFFENFESLSENQQIETCNEIVKALIEIERGI